MAKFDKGQVGPHVDKLKELDGATSWCAPPPLANVALEVPRHSSAALRAIERHSSARSGLMAACAGRQDHVRVRGEG